MKKTNIRVRRNGGSKTASPQVPNNPESARARTNKTGQRFDGIVKSFNAELGFGFISVTAELATKLKLKPEQDLYFHADALPDGKAQLLRAGAKVSFAVERTGKGPRAVAIKTRTLATTLTAAGWEEFGQGNEVAIALMGNINLEVREELMRDVNGQMLVTRYTEPPVYRDVTFDQACDWLVNNGEQRAPEKFLELHGIMPKKEKQPAETLGPNFARLFDELESSIDQTQALFILMEREIMNPDGGNWNQDIENGFFELHHQTSERLRAAKCNLWDVCKGGAQ